MPPGKNVMKKIINEEERILQMERQKIADKEAAKKKEIMLCEYLKIKSAKESKAFNLNLKTVDLHTRYKMRREKTEELKKESFILYQTFERILDLKNVTISNLLKQIEEAKRQYETSVSSHMQNIDTVIDFQRHVLYSVDAKFSDDCQKSKQQYEMEFQLIEKRNRKDLSDLADIFFALKISYEQKESHIEANFQNSVDEINNKCLEDKHSLKAQLDIVGENLWKEFKQTYDNYNKSTEERRRLFEELSGKDVQNSTEISQQRKKIQKLTEGINHFKLKLAKNQRENEEINNKLKQEKDKTNKIFYSMKSDMNKLRQIEKDRLSQVVVKSSSAIKELSTILNAGKRLILLAEQSRKFETEQEKILPFYESIISNEEINENSISFSEKLNPFKAIIDDEEREMMWKRYNSVALNVICMQEKQKNLVNENQYLRDILKQYLDGLSVNSNVIDNDNSLFVVNGKTNAPITVNGLDHSKAMEAMKVLGTF